MNTNLVWKGYAIIFFLIIAAIIIGIIVFYSRKTPGDPCTGGCNSMVCELNQCKVSTGGGCDISSDCISGDSCNDINICVTIGP